MMSNKNGLFKILIVDTETTGLPLDYNASFQDTANWPRIIQLAYQQIWSNGEVIKKSCTLIKPDGWEVPDKEHFLAKGYTEEKAIEKSKFWTDNGYSTKQCEKEGRPMPEVLTELAMLMNSSDVMVAHNLSYDKPVIECEMFRYGIFPKRVAKDHPVDLRPEGVKLRKECTKLLMQPVCKILVGSRGDYKWPSLQEAYFFCFRQDVQNAHDAGADVEACKQIYLWYLEYELMKEFL